MIGPRAKVKLFQFRKTKEDGGYGKRKDNVDENDEGLGGYRQRVQERIGDRRPATSPEDKHFLDAPLGWALEIFLSALPSVTPITACSAIADLILTELEVLSISPAGQKLISRLATHSPCSHFSATVKLRTFTAPSKWRALQLLALWLP